MKMNMVVGAGLFAVGSAFVAPPLGSLPSVRAGPAPGDNAAVWGDASSAAPVGTATGGSCGAALLVASAALLAARACLRTKCGRNASLSQSEEHSVQMNAGSFSGSYDGRMAMLAAVHANTMYGSADPVSADGFNGKESSFLKAFESELGVQPPLGYWDPAGLAKDGNLGNYVRRRTVELKHGRVCMLASLGYMVPEFFRWPGYISPSAKLAFTDIPSGLAAMSKISGGGWAQIIIFVGFVETGYYQSDPNRPPGDYANGGVLGVPNSSTLPSGEEKQRRLSAEIANGRLAMAAIMGMLFQDGLTGSAWGSWSKYADGVLR